MAASWNLPAAGVALKLYLSLGGTAPTNFYLALGQTSANPAGTFTELTVANYSRQPITWAYIADAYATNSAPVVFNNLGAGTLIGQRIYTASSGGSIVAWNDIAAVTWASGFSFTYNTGVIKLGISV